MGEGNTIQGGIMLLFVTIALLHNATVLLNLCKGTQKLSRHKLIVRVPLVCDRQSGSEKRILHHYNRLSNTPA